MRLQLPPPLSSSPPPPLRGGGGGRPGGIQVIGAAGKGRGGERHHTAGKPVLDGTDAEGQPGGGDAGTPPTPGGRALQGPGWSLPPPPPPPRIRGSRIRRSGCGPVHEGWGRSVGRAPSRFAARWQTPSSPPPRSPAAPRCAPPQRPQSKRVCCCWIQLCVFPHPHWAKFKCSFPKSHRGLPVPFTPRRTDRGPTTGISDGKWVFLIRSVTVVVPLPWALFLSPWCEAHHTPEPRSRRIYQSPSRPQRCAPHPSHIPP